MTLAAHDPTVHSAYRFGALALLLAVGSILGALAFEHLGGLAPCELCLQQRYAYYAGIPAMAAALALLVQGRARVAAAILLAVAAGFVVNAGLGVYHPDWALKLLVIACFVMLTNPLSSHALSRAAYAVRTPMTSTTIADALAEKDHHAEGGSGT